jgi:alcohol dehydrogenase YqhD (iron-dependent ADH family)
VGGLGLPTSLKEIGLSNEKDYLEIAKACGTTTMSGTIGNLKRLDTSDILHILNDCK